VPRMVRGRPSGLKAAAHRLRRRPDGRPWPRMSLRPLAAGTHGPGQGLPAAARTTPAQLIW